MFYQIGQYHSFVRIDKTIGAEKAQWFHLQKKGHQHGVYGMEKGEVKPGKYSDSDASNNY
jgi:hypothetical protein